MRRAILLAGLVLTVSLVGPASAPGAAGGTDLPWRTSGSGFSTINQATGEVHAVLTGTGIHLGRGTFEEHGFSVPTGLPGIFNFSSDWTTTAASGDQVFGTCAGTITTTDGVHFTLLLDCPITGGTGRFEGVSGRFTATVFSTRVSIDGTIATNRVEATSVGQISVNRRRREATQGAAAWGAP